MAEKAKKEIKNVAGYIRVSTDGQAKDGYGLEAQKEEIKDYCKTQGYTITKWVADEGKSGAKERGALDHLISDNDQRYGVDAIVVAKSDRVARNVKLYFYYSFRIQRAGMELISVTENEQLSALSGPVKDLYESLIAFIAEIERENIAQRMSTGRKQKAKSGGYSGGRPPLGYKTSMDKELIIDDKDAKTVKLIFSLWEQGDSQDRIANTLNDMGLKPHYGKKFYNSNVGVVLKNQMFYRGYYRYGKDKKWIKGKHEPLLADREYKKGNMIAKD